MFGSHAGGTSGAGHGIGTFGSFGRPGTCGTLGVCGTCTDGGVTGTAPPTPGVCGAAGAGSFGAAGVGSFGVGTGSDGRVGGFAGVGALRWVGDPFAGSEVGASDFVTAGIGIPGWVGAGEGP